MAFRSSASNVGNSFSFFSFNSSNPRTWIHCVPNSIASERVFASFNIR